MNSCPISGKPCELLKIHNVSVVNEGCSEHMFLCEQCAAGYFNDESPKEIKNSRFLPQMVNARDMLDLLKNGFHKKTNKESNPVRRCPNCKSTIERIAKTGRLGCVKCFDYFGEELSPILTKMGQNKEEPKQEAKAEVRIEDTSLEGRYERLMANLGEALAREEYEAAAVLREKIKAVQSIQQEKKQLEISLDEAVQNEDFSKAQEIKRLVADLVEKMIQKLN
jgi:protein arginine kinase activator